jgi:hypothetical protein
LVLQIAATASKNLVTGDSRESAGDGLLRIAGHLERVVSAEKWPKRPFFVAKW